MTKIQVKKNYSTLNLLLPVGLKNELEKRAEENCRSFSGEVRHILLGVINNEKKLQSNTFEFLNKVVSRKKKILSQCQRKIDLNKDRKPMK